MSTFDLMLVGYKVNKVQVLSWLQHIHELVQQISEKLLAIHNGSK